MNKENKEYKEKEQEKYESETSRIPTKKNEESLDNLI